MEERRWHRGTDYVSTGGHSDAFRWVQGISERTETTSQVSREQLAEAQSRRGPRSVCTDLEPCTLILSASGHLSLTLLSANKSNCGEEIKGVLFSAEGTSALSFHSGALMRQCCSDLPHLNHACQWSIHLFRGT